MIFFTTYKKLPFLLIPFLLTDQLHSALADKKPWTIMIYMAAANDLAIFAPRNLAQMQKIGSTDSVNIVVHHNTHDRKKQRSRTYFIEKGNKKLLEEQWDGLDSGNPYNLIEFCTKTIANFPAEQYALIFWNHGSGAIEPLFRSNLSAEELFTVTANKAFFEPTHSFSIFPRYKGVCFNDTTNSFLTEEHLVFALDTICSKSLNGKRFSLIGFDACFMAMIEVAIALQPYAKLMVASQDVEKGSGWNYKDTFSLFLNNNSPSPEEFGAHIVTSYAKTYKTMENFTQSCIYLDDLEPLSNTLVNISYILQQIGKKCATNFFTTIIKSSKHKHMCTHFDEPDFIDLIHFLKNLSTLLDSTNLQENESVLNDVAQLRFFVAQALNFFTTVIHKNLTGSSFPNAYGLSIYLPERSLHSSYPKTIFAQKTSWHLFIKTYLSARKKERYT